MARAKATTPKKTTAKKTTKKVVDDFPVDDLINNLKGTTMKDEGAQLGRKKIYKKDKQTETVQPTEETIEQVEVKNETPDETIFEDELLEKSINPDGDIETVETVNVDEVVKETAEELREEIKETEQPKVETKREAFLRKARKIVTYHKHMGQIIDF